MPPTPTSVFFEYSEGLQASRKILLSSYIEKKTEQYGVSTLQKGQGAEGNWVPEGAGEAKEREKESGLFQLLLQNSGGGDFCEEQFPRWFNTLPLIPHRVPICLI